MSESKVIEIIDKLVEKTSLKQAIWDITSKADQFVLNLGDSSITIEKWEDNTMLHYFTLIIRGSFGQLVYQISISNEENNDTYKRLKSLHEVAKSSYFKIDETLNDIFNKVNSDKVIGFKDDVPF